MLKLIIAYRRVNPTNIGTSLSVRKLFVKIVHTRLLKHRNENCSHQRQVIAVYTLDYTTATTTTIVNMLDRNRYDL